MPVGTAQLGCTTLETAGIEGFFTVITWVNMVLVFKQASIATHVLVYVPLVAPATKEPEVFWYVILPLQLSVATGDKA